VEGTKLRGDNPGITVSTPSAGMAVKSVFNGEVAGVYNMGDGYGSNRYAMENTLLLIAT
jgi:hypothetical protein